MRRSHPVTLLIFPTLSLSLLPYTYVKCVFASSASFVSAMFHRTKEVSIICTVKRLAAVGCRYCLLGAIFRNSGPTHWFVCSLLSLAVLSLCFWLSLVIFSVLASQLIVYYINFSQSQFFVLVKTPAMGKKKQKNWSMEFHPQWLAFSLVLVIYK